jgi:glycosyltransferase involved in cell wall biosynthesis
MRLALVVQRYGEDVAGGAELHARYAAAILARSHQVTVLTTTAKDYITWENHYPVGAAAVEGIEVLRFPVERPRSLDRFALAQTRAFAPGASDADEEIYLAEQGPLAPGLARHLRESTDRYDAVVAFSFRYLTTIEAAAVRPTRTLLVPTAEDDPAVGLATARRLFRSVGAIAYNSPEERAMIEASAANQDVPGEVVGIGSRIPDRVEPKRFRDRHGIDFPYLLYVGRIDRNKGCDELFEWFASFVAETGSAHHLLLIGSAVLAIPAHPRIRHLGFVSDQEKFDALAGAEVLLMPSPYESLSMVTLEAMALGVPPLVNGRCDVLEGQVRRSNAGLYYESYEAFFESLWLLVSTPRLRAVLGAKGRSFYSANYNDAVIAAKFDRLLARLRST